MSTQSLELKNRVLGIRKNASGSTNKLMVNFSKMLESSSDWEIPTAAGVVLLYIGKGRRELPDLGKEVKAPVHEVWAIWPNGDISFHSISTKGNECHATPMSIIKPEDVEVVVNGRQVPEREEGRILKDRDGNTRMVDRDKIIIPAGDTSAERVSKFLDIFDAKVNEQVKNEKKEAGQVPSANETAETTI